MAARFWVAGGTGNWSSTTNWSATTGGASGASVPGSADAATFNASSGAGIATVDSNVTIQTLTMSGFTGTLAFGTNTLSLNSTGTVYTGATTFSVTGTPIINVTSAGSTAIMVSSGTVTEADSISFSFTAGTYSLTLTGNVKNVDFTGFAGSFVLGLVTVYGSWNVPSGSSMTFSASTATLTFGATSGTKTIYTNAKPMDFPIDFNGVGGIFQLTSNMVVGSSSTASTRQARLFGGTLDLNNFSLISGTWSGGSSLVRALAFGTSGSITVVGSGTSLILNNSCTAALNFSYTGTSIFYVSNNSGTASNIAIALATESVAMNYTINTGTYALTAFAGANSAKNLDFTGFSGTFANAWNAVTIFSNLTLSSTAGAPLASASQLNFSATSGTQIITTNGKTIDKPITVNGVGGTVRLADALLMGTTRAFTHTNGTLDLNGKTLTVGTTYATAAGTKDITFNGGTLVCPAVTTTAFNNAAPTGFTTTAGTGTGKISMTGATAKTFVGGGATYNCTLSNDGAGALTVSGSNTFTAIANGVQPTAFTFTAATTQTVTNWNVSGTAGNLVTIISSTAGVPALLSKASGTVSSDYLSLKDSTALGGAAWYAGANSTNVSGNLGWIFTAPAATNTGNFFFMF